MALASLAVLDKHKATPFPEGYDPNVRSFYSPIDDVSGALADTISAATRAPRAPQAQGSSTPRECAGRSRNLVCNLVTSPDWRAWPRDAIDDG